MSNAALTRYGFTFGAMKVERMATLPNGSTVLSITTDAGKSLQVYASGKGRSLRVFTPGEGEWSPAPVTERDA